MSLTESLSRPFANNFDKRASLETFVTSESSLFELDTHTLVLVYSTPSLLTCVEISEFLLFLYLLAQIKKLH